MFYIVFVYFLIVFKEVQNNQQQQKSAEKPRYIS